LVEIISTNLNYIKCLQVMSACPMRKPSWRITYTHKPSWRITYMHDSHSLFLLFSSPHLIREIPDQGTAAAHMALSSDQSGSLTDSLCLPDSGGDEGCRPTTGMEAVPLVGQRPRRPPEGRVAREGRRHSLTSTQEIKSGNAWISPSSRCRRAFVRFHN
jgi:hypothetical protein